MKFVYPTWLTKCDAADFEEAYEETNREERPAAGTDAADQRSSLNAHTILTPSKCRGIRFR